VGAPAFSDPALSFAKPSRNTVTAVDISLWVMPHRAYALLSRFCSGAVDLDLTCPGIQDRLKVERMAPAN
jgi:hypothetical protein